MVTVSRGKCSVQRSNVGSTNSLNGAFWGTKRGLSRGYGGRDGVDDSDLAMCGLDGLFFGMQALGESLVSISHRGVSLGELGNVMLELCDVTKKLLPS